MTTCLLTEATRESVPVEGSCAEALVRCLEAEGVKMVFGVPGEETLDIIEAMRISQQERNGLKFIVCRHEQAAGFMACSVARLTGEMSVFLSTLGPGATNCSTALAHAFLAGIPVMVLTGQKPVRQNKQGQFQVIDVVDHFKSITKFTRSVTDPSLITSLVRKCFRISRLEKPGPVHLEIPEDIASLSVGPGRFIFPRRLLKRPSADQDILDRAIELIRFAKRPLLCIGSAAGRLPFADKALNSLMESTGLYAVSTQMGKGLVDEANDRFIGCTALSQNDLVHCAINSADLIINIGHDTTEKPPFLMKHNSLPVIIHLSYCPARVDDIYFPHLEIIGDVPSAVDRLTKGLSEGERNWDFSVFSKVREFIKKNIFESSHCFSEDFPMTIQRVVHDTQTALDRNSICCLDTGMYKIWFARQYISHYPSSVLVDNALATMGAGLPYAIGAKLTFPDRQVVAFCGDGGFMMNSQELETAVRLKLHLVVVVVNDGAYGMIRWKQEAEGFEDFGLCYSNPDFVKYAESYGAIGYRVTKPSDFSKFLKEAACNSQGGVHLIEVPVNYCKSTISLGSELSVQLAQLDEVIDQMTKKTSCEHAKVIEAPPSIVRSHEQKVSELESAEKVVSMPLFLGKTPYQSIEVLPVINKYSGERIATVSLAGPEILQQAITLAVRAQSKMEALPLFKRKKILCHCVSRFKERAEELATILSKEAGKPIKDSRGEVGRLIETFQLASEECTRQYGEYQRMDYVERGLGYQQIVRRFPVGPIAMISPYNFPLNLAAHKIAPAIAVGCCFVLKPASLTPLSALVIGEVLAECDDLPEGSFSILPSTRTAADLLIISEDIKMLSFTGSPSVGWDIKARAGKKKVVLELGGNAACIVDDVPEENKKFNSFIDRLIMGCFYQSGQSCIHLQRLFIKRAHYQKVVNSLVSAVKNLRTGDPLEESTFIGPIISDSECSRIESWVSSALANGAKCLIGGKRIDNSNTYEPTILANVRNTSKVWAEEVFGPVVCVASYDNFSNCVSLVNDSNFGIHCGIFSNDMGKIMYSWEQLQVGGVVVNDVPSVRFDAMPYGGVKDSGLGREGIRYAMEDMTEIKSLLIRSSNCQENVDERVSSLPSV